MSEDCRNDCVPPLRFPRRPGSVLAACPADDFCCDDNARTDTRNRPGLAHFNYRVGTYSSIREWLLHRLNQQPALREWTHRKADDPGIALLEGAALVGDILTFYQELYANEAFLRTATQRSSIADLVRLTGYRLAPGLGGNATFAFAAKGTQPLKIPARFPLKAQLAGQSKPAEFETTEAVTAYPWLNKLNLYRPLTTPQITPATTEFYISAPNQYATPVVVKVGDRLLIGDADPTHGADKLNQAETVIVESVRQFFGVQLIKIKGALKRTTNAHQLAAYKLGRAFHHFGYNGPATVVRTPQTTNSTATTTTSGGTQTTHVSSTLNTDPVSFRRLVDAATTASSPDLGPTEFPLDAEVRDLPNGVSFVVQGSFTRAPSGHEWWRSTWPQELTLVRRIADVKPLALTWGQLSTTVSVVKLDAGLSALTGGYNRADIRGLALHETASPPLTLKAAFQPTNPASGPELAFFGTRGQALSLHQRRILLEQMGREAKQLTVADVQAVSTNPEFPQFHAVTLSAPVSYADFPTEKPPVTVYGNLADADEGKTLAAAPLGNGNNTLIFQTFELPKPALTYHLAPENTPPATPGLDVYVNGRQWRRVESFFGRRGDEEIYLVREDAANKSWVQFGDGKTGAKLPTGINNVVAVQRVGSGAFGSLEEGVTPQAGAKLNGLDKVFLPGIVTGGAAPEAESCARQAAPGRLQSLGRLVSAQDFASEALALPGVAKVAAAWQLYGHVPAVVVTVLMETGRGGELAAVRNTLANYNRTRGAQRFPVIVLEGRRLWVNLTVQYALDPTFQASLVEPEIRAALGVSLGLPLNQETQSGLFSLPRREFGAREYATSCAGVVNQIAGVLWAQVTAFNALNDTDDPASIGLLPTTFNAVAPCDAAHLLALYQTHLSLTQVADTGGAA